jgi:hypothetical protein
MVKFYVNGTIAPKEEENFVRLVKEGRNIRQGGVIINGEQKQIPLFERVPDIEILRKFLQF